jgi:hypothetical protein
MMENALLRLTLLSYRRNRRVMFKVTCFETIAVRPADITIHGNEAKCLYVCELRVQAVHMERPSLSLSIAIRSGTAFALLPSEFRLEHNVDTYAHTIGLEPPRCLLSCADTSFQSVAVE